MKTVKQETRSGTDQLEEEDTYELIKGLTPTKRGRCRSTAKAVGMACVRRWEEHETTLDDRLGVAVSRAAYFLRTKPEREAEVIKAAAELLKVARSRQSK